jgi:hypothetical protein
VTTCVAAAQADFAEVNLTAWSSPSETDREESQARVVLCQFLGCWWANNLKREAMWWWGCNGHDPLDLAAIKDCFF